MVFQIKIISLFLDKPIPLSSKKGLDKTAMAKVKQDYPQGCTQNVCDHVHELGASCRKVTLDQFDKKTYATSDHSRPKKKLKM
jgi:hypothetical protein